MLYHVLTGDSLAEQFGQTSIKGEVIISRECLVEGPADNSSDLNKFWQTRAAFLTTAYPEVEKNYKVEVAAEYERLLHLPAESEVYLWFEYDLFCQVNMWFSLWLLNQNKNNLQLYHVFPVIRKEAAIWKGFGKLDSAALEMCFAQRVHFTDSDVELGVQLWRAYSENDMIKLKALSTTESLCFPHLQEVCEAQIQRQQGRVAQTLQRIMANGATDFNVIYTDFFKTEGIYGFGDLQVKRMMEIL